MITLRELAVDGRSERPLADYAKPCRLGSENSGVAKFFELSRAIGPREFSKRRAGKGPTLIFATAEKLVYVTIN